MPSPFEHCEYEPVAGAHRALKERLAVVPRDFTAGDALVLGLLSAAAFGGNLLALPLFAGVDFLFGGIAVMIAVLRLSLLETLLVAASGSLATLLLWGHPYAMVIFMAEAACVYFLYARWGHEITLYDAAFWIVVGAPLVVVFCHLVIGMDWVATGLIALKHPVNALLYTAAASILHHGSLLRGWRAPTARREIRLAHLAAPVLLVFALVPTLVVLSLYSQVERQESFTRMANELHAAVRYLDPYETSRGDVSGAVAQWRERLGPLAIDKPAVALVDDAATPIAESPEGWLSGRPARRDVAFGLVQHYTGGAEATMVEQRDSYFTHRVSAPWAPAVPGATDFELVLGVQAAPYVDRLRGLQLAALGLAAAIGIGGVIVGSFVARRSGRLFAPIIERIRQIPNNVRDGQSTAWPSSPVAEIAALADGARDVEEELAGHLEALAQTEERFRAIADNLPGDVYERVMEPDGRIRFTYLSPFFKDVMGVDPDHGIADADVVIGRIHPDDRPDYYAALEQSAHSLMPLDVTFRFRGPEGEERWARSLAQPRERADGGVIWYGIAIDETARKQAEQELEHLAHYDGMTGLLNRHETLRQLSSLLGDPAMRAPVAVLYVDLDHVKQANDTLGHAAGDKIIQEAARRIQGAVRDEDRAGRYGGDEFVILATGIGDEEAAIGLAQRILEAVCGTFQVAGREMEMSATIGILIQPDPHDDSAECLRKADVALYHGKRERRGTWWFYSPTMDANQLRRVNLLADLRAALQDPDNQFFIEYQPKIDLATGHLRGVEALVRWQHAEEGRIPPDWFIPLAEEAGLIDALGDWILRRACADFTGWRRQDAQAAPHQMSVNISGVQLATDALYHSVSSVLSNYDMAPDTLELEITESVFYSGRSPALERLSASGVCLAIDDFGKGYSSLFVLRDSPADVVKIDRSFVNRMQHSQADRLIVESTIHLAHALGRFVVAEGVETSEQLETLRELGCDSAQGFYLERPMAATRIPEIWHRRW